MKDKKVIKLVEKTSEKHINKLSNLENKIEQLHNNLYNGNFIPKESAPIYFEVAQSNLWDFFQLLQYVESEKGLNENELYSEYLKYIKETNSNTSVFCKITKKLFNYQLQIWWYYNNNRKLKLKETEQGSLPIWKGLVLEKTVNSPEEITETKKAEEKKENND